MFYISFRYATDGQNIELDKTNKAMSQVSQFCRSLEPSGDDDNGAVTIVGVVIAGVVFIALLITVFVLLRKSKLTLSKYQPDQRLVMVLYVLKAGVSKI